MTRRSLILVLCLTAAFVTAAAAAPRWRLESPENSLGTVCITSGDTEVSYHRLEAGTATNIQVRGPRRVKIVTRYVFGPEKSLQAGYTVCVAIDGRDVLDETVTAHTADRRSTCDESGRVGVMRRFYVDVPTGLHTIETTPAPAGGTVTARSSVNDVNVRSSGCPSRPSATWPWISCSSKPARAPPTTFSTPTIP